MKWLLGRIYECSEAKDNKTQWMNSFKDAYKSMYNRDGKPKSYLSPVYEEARLYRIRTRTKGPQRSKSVIVKSPRRMSVGSGCGGLNSEQQKVKHITFIKNLALFSGKNLRMIWCAFKQIMKMFIDLRVHETYESSPGVNEDSKFK